MNKTFKALAHPIRREILALLRDGPMISGDIADHFDVAWPTMTGHLKVLKTAGLVHGERFGTQIRYRLNMGAAEEALAALASLFGVSRVEKREKK